MNKPEEPYHPRPSFWEVMNVHMESPQHVRRPTIEPSQLYNSSSLPSPSGDTAVSSPMTPIPNVPPPTPDPGMSPSQIPSLRRLSSVTFVDIPSPLVGPHASPRDLGSLAEWHVMISENIPQLNLLDEKESCGLGEDGQSELRKKGGENPQDSHRVETKLANSENIKKEHYLNNGNDGGVKISSSDSNSTKENHQQINEEVIANNSEEGECGS
jgi:hypothetical protein